MKKAVLIGASSGIGYEIARQLLKKGWKLGVAARRKERLDELQREAPDRIVSMRIDVTCAEASVQLHRLIDMLGGMQLMVYAAGVGHQNRQLNEEIELETVQTNCMGFTRMVGEAYRYFANLGEGHIAVITSIAGTKGLGPAPSYSATKAMQSTYLEALEQQVSMRGLNIKITDIRPGFVDTDLLAGDFRYPMLMKPDVVARKILKSIERKQRVVVIDWRYRLLTAVWRCIPRCVWRYMKL